MTLTSIFLLAVLALATYGAYRVVKRFRSTDSALSPWQRVLATAMGSASVLWNGIVAVVGGAMSYSVYASEALNAPEVGTFIQANINPKYLGLTVALIGVVGVLARLRTLWSGWRAQGAA